ncbi:PREDICTED: multimerin-1 [Nanorana parkeri]|uniref:multimerin-1 n=1 Tax=Nanorana parkeri TaxID=125878 RepID=UPI00085446E8|nr:PREDICTED: multimerin-1 [Nanorana parkeri]
MELILLLAIFLHIDGCKTGDFITVTEDTWTEPEDTNVRRLLFELNPQISIPNTQSPEEIKTTQFQDEATALQSSTSTTAILPKARRKEYKMFEKIIRMPVRAPPPTEVTREEATKVNDEQLMATKKAPPQTENVQPGTNRSPRQNYYKSNSQKPSFETTRGKNWCAYVHTRLMPTVAMENVETYVSGGTNPCAWNIGACSVRSRIISKPAYRMRHKIVTSLEWKCCPGYSGQHCVVSAQQIQRQIHGSQAESSLSINTVDSGDRETATYDQALQQKLTDQIYSQEMKLTLLNRNVENISSSLNDIHSSLYSLEEKINDADKGQNLQSFLKDPMAKSLTELIKNIVKDQFTILQMDMKETIAQIYKTVSETSLEVEKIKESVKHLNTTITSAHQKCAEEEENKASKEDVLELKNRIEHLKNTAFVCTSSFKDMEKRHSALEEELNHEQSRNRDYFETLNSTLSKMKEIHDQMLTGNHVKEQRVQITPYNFNDDNVTEYLLALQERMKKQNIMMLQLYDDIYAQDSKINNLTVTLDLQKQSSEKACEDKFATCKDDFQKQLKGTEENMHVLNKTVSDVVIPLDDKIDKMNEQINDLCYDMEILQPFIEKGAPFSRTTEYELKNDVNEVNQQIQNITEFLNTLNSIVHVIMKGQDKLQIEAEKREELFERRFNECIMEVEDGLNNTMDILNDAVDSIRDEFVTKSAISDMQNKAELYTNATIEKLESALLAIPAMNETLQNLTTAPRIHKDNSTSTHYAVGFSQDDTSMASSFLELSQKINSLQSKLFECQVNITKIEENVEISVTNVQNCQSRVQIIESQVNMILANPTALPKAKPVEVLTNQKSVLQEVYSRIKALEFKSIRLSTSIPQLNKTANEAKVLCQTVFVTVKKVNESVPKLVEAAQPNIASLQKGFEELIRSLIQIKMSTVLTNLTGYVDKSLSDITTNMAKLQKQMKAPVKKTLVPKKLSINPTVSIIGRSQRNSDIIDQANDHSSCSSSPCYNGGTCINDLKGFVCACRHPFGGLNCSLKMTDENAQSLDFSKGSYRYAPMVAFSVSHTYGMTSPGPIRFNNLYVNYGSSYTPSTGKFNVPYLGVYVFKFTIESYSPRLSGYLVVDGIDKIAFQSENINSSVYSDRTVTGDALLELNYGQTVWLRLATGTIPAQYPPVTTFSGYLLYRT